MHIFFKIINRFFALIRSIRFFLYVKLCGGKIYGLPKVGKNIVWKYPPHRGVIIGRRVDFGSNCFIEVPLNGYLEIGNNVKFTHNVIISALKEIVILESTLIAEFCSLRDSTHKTVKGIDIRKQEGIYGTIYIGRDVWVGRNSSVFMNTVINDGAIIGANTLCSKREFKENSIYVGTPAKFLKER